MKFKGTLIAVIIIILLAIVSRFGFNESFERKEVIVEPTEDVTLEPMEGNYYFGAMPTEN